jgi:hypothetical protein
MISLKFFFWGGVTATAPSRDLTDNNKKRGERAQAEKKAKRSCSRRPRTKERKPGKRKKNQVEYRDQILWSLIFLQVPPKFLSWNTVVGSKEVQKSSEDLHFLFFAVA